MKIKVKINKILRITAGRFHCWCDSNVGRIKKENKNVPEFIWDTFLGKKPKVNENALSKDFVDKFWRKTEKKLKWYQRLWNWIRKFI